MEWTCCKCEHKFTELTGDIDEKMCFECMESEDQMPTNNKPKPYGYILLADPFQVDLRDLVTPPPGFCFPAPIRLVRTRPAIAGQMDPPLRLIPFSGYGVEKTFDNIEELLTEMRKGGAREEDLEGLNN